MTQYVCNIKKSSIDNRDYIYIGSILNLPEILDYRDNLTKIRDQGAQGTCFAHTAACVKEWQERKNNNFTEYFSPQFFYNNRFNKYDDNIDNDEGMFPRDVMKLLKTVGICSESSYPYGKIESKTEIKSEIYDEAKLNIIHSYAKINTMTKLKNSLYENGPCLISFPVYNYTSNFWLGDENSFIGGHAVTVVGYNLEGFIIRNSWGKYWGEKGYSIYKYTDWGCHWELWTVIDENIIYNIEYINEGNINKLLDEKKNSNKEKNDNKSISYIGEYDSVNDSLGDDSIENIIEDHINVPLYKKILRHLCPKL